MGYEFKLPDLGEGIHEAQIVRVMVVQGATVAEDAPILEVETDKAAVEIPSPVGGTVSTIHVSEGQTVNVGDVMITFDETAPSDSKEAAAASDSKGAPAAKKAKASPPTKADAPPEPPAPAGADAPSAPAAGRRTTTPAAPAVRKLARNLGIDLDTVAPSGPGGRVTRSDVEKAAASASGPGSLPAGASAPGAIPSGVATPGPAPSTGAAPVGVADADRWGPIRRAPLTQIRKTIARRMAESASTIPHVTTFDFADITELERLRKASGDGESGRPRLTVLALVIKAVGWVLTRHPIFNASYDAEREELIYKDYINVGIAVDTDRGLVVPVLRAVDRMTLSGVVAALETLAGQARSAHFAIEDLRGGTFTITNIGAIGGTFFTPIINYPESAILGVGRSRWEPAVVDGRVEPRYRLPIGLTFDHRIADGAQAARCLKELIACLENPGWFLMA